MSGSSLLTRKGINGLCNIIIEIMVLASQMLLSRFDGERVTFCSGFFSECYGVFVLVFHKMGKASSTRLRQICCVCSFVLSVRLRLSSVSILNVTVKNKCYKLAVETVCLFLPWLFLLC